MFCECHEYSCDVAAEAAHVWVGKSRMGGDNVNLGLGCLRSLEQVREEEEEEA